MSLPYTLFDTLLEPIFILNSEQKVVYCNETAALLTGLSIRKITRGLLFDQILTFSESITALKNLTGVVDLIPYKELQFTNQSGIQGKVQIAIQPTLTSDGQRHWVIFVRDVTLEERLQKKYRAELEEKEDVIHDLEQAKEQLQNYSKNLEAMVAERTLALSRMNQMMSALLDSLGQGFFIFDKSGHCLEVSSKACLETVETIPTGKMIWDILKLPTSKIEGLKRWLLTLFSEMLPFEDLAPLGPSTFAHSGKKNISLEYFPLRGENAAMEGIVVVATDITSLVEAQGQAEKEKEKAKLIINLVKNKREVSRLIRDSELIIGDLNHELTKNSSMDVEAVYRHLHTLKGGAASFSIQEMAEACHHAEDQVQLFKENKNAETLFVLSQLCKEIEKSFNTFLNEAKEILGAGTMNFDGQFEITYTKLNQVVKRIQKLPGGQEAATLLISELMMEPIGSFFEPYRDLSFRLASIEEKNLTSVEFHNPEIAVLSEAYSHLFATFVHAFRNAVDHGLVKERPGKIDVYFELIKNKTLLEIRILDNGSGIDPAKIRAKLQQNPRTFPNESDEKIIQHIFDSQFSTRDLVTENSGRGVGLDAIKMAAKQLGGRVFVKSKLAKGTELIVTVPYILTIPEKIKTAA